ncbi:Uncharacterised protein [Vibrio cholerae]|nr:Uncharacterised protein [Vibrio cholerae]
MPVALNHHAVGAFRAAWWCIQSARLQVNDRPCTAPTLHQSAAGRGCWKGQTLQGETG